ncbi:PREDICTED: WAP four-disulfide core domain protein 12 [Elephantulus edwardii]|uniref:WAP four-disulfide core domain protein 12 n=1 Tax=Elephantulus edwardii TaxID=28737 RepID=UPI0003F05A2F|nr:PREDICTED: WAP four-disulfide core domain protein 12 [Elephantulus edwardii]
MRPTSYLILMVFLLFVTLVMGERNREKKEKSGVCPFESRICYRSDIPRCGQDQHCLRNKKCCYVECGFRCVIPLKKTIKGEALAPL